MPAADYYGMELLQGSMRCQTDLAFVMGHSAWKAAAANEVLQGHTGTTVTVAAVVQTRAARGCQAPDDILGGARLHATHATEHTGSAGERAVRIHASKKLLRVPCRWTRGPRLQQSCMRCVSNGVRQTTKALPCPALNRGDGTRHI